MDGAAAAEVLREQIRHVRGRSPLYERLLAGLAGAAERGFDGGVVARLLTASPSTGLAEARQLLLAALHDAALRDPTLPHAAWFPTSARERHRAVEEGAPGALALAYLVEHEDEVAEFLRTTRLQTNEVGRFAALLPGFLVAGGFGLPLRLLELGTSAGLHLRFDRYHVRYLGGPSWGPVGGPEVESRAEGVIPRTLTPPTVDIAERRGVDLNPLDPSDPDDSRLLRSFVWADELDRHDRLDRALAVARSTPAQLDRDDLVAWADRHAHAVEGTTTVLFHSQVRHLLDPASVSRLGDVTERALRSATPDAPFVSFGFEAPRGVPDDGSNWPELVVGVGDGSGPPIWHTLLSADWHGRWVRWFAQA